MKALVFLHVSTILGDHANLFFVIFSILIITTAARFC